MREIREIFEDLPVRLYSLKEAGLALTRRKTARPLRKTPSLRRRPSLCRCARTPIVMSDDSGLCVDYLNGEPGVYSARWLGRDTSYAEKNAELIRRLEGVEGEARSARFTAAIACILPDGTRLLSEAHMEGQIAKAPAGQNGFGYDPILYLPEYGKCSAELSDHEKNAISHRGKALRQMQEKLRDLLAAEER